MVISGYLESQTNAFTSDGFFRTGDLFFRDERSVFYFQGRLKDTLKVSGFQVSPAELEAVLLQHSSLADAAVLGIPNLLEGEVPCALVVLAHPVQLQDLIDLLQAKLSRHKWIREFRLCSRLPRSQAGKLLRRELPALWDESPSMN
jgi:acyl-coenzyme A synthetase/AMP-(fatty) acid ligase